jgi:hypothetical protein
MNNLIESGEPIVVDECRRCGLQKARGVSFVRAGKLCFRCDECGRSMLLDYLEEAHKKQVEGRLNHEKATENRDRFWRENQQKQEMEYKTLKEIPGAQAESAFNIDYATRKWRF